MGGEAFEYEIVGKIVYAGFDAEGNIHLILKNNHKFWSKVAINLLKTMEGDVVKLAVKPWAGKGKSERGDRKPAFLCLVGKN